MIGAKTIGNATLIAIDDVPVLATDPWLCGHRAYFGSWHLPFEIPPEELDNILNCQYVFFSHGHPDHLNGESLDRLADKIILLPDHVGGRINRELTSNGLTTRVLPDRQWVELSKHVRILCVSDYYQDAILLVDVNGHLFIDMNDASDRAWGGLVRLTIKQFKTSYLLKISGWGEADMINFFDEDGKRAMPKHVVARPPIGKNLSHFADLYGVNYVVPFSSFHKLQRTDSHWAQEHVPTLEDYPRGFNAKRASLLPPFIEVDCETGAIREINPPRTPDSLRPPEDFGDNWSDLLEADDIAKVDAYFQEREALKDTVGFVNLRVGGKDHSVTLDRKKKTGVTFEVPRGSLMTAIEYEIFDDLFIGNFMKTTLHGGLPALVPGFNPVVSKYSDNGRAKTKAELRAYMAAYRKRAPAAFLLHVMEHESARRFRQVVSSDTLLFSLVQRNYVFLKQGKVAS